MMHVVCRCGIVLLLIASVKPGCIFAQGPLAFETASVKPNRNPHEPRLQILPSSRVSIVGYSLRMLLSWTRDIPYQSSAERVFGGPDWVRTETDDIEAVAPGVEASPAARQQQVRLMLRQLLQERFHLQATESQREMSIYTMLVAKVGVKLQPSPISDNDCDQAGTRPACHEVIGGQGGGLHARAASIGDIARFIEHWSDRPIVDHTGLTSLYQIDTVGWAPLTPRQPSPDGTTSSEDQAVGDPTRPTLFSLRTGIGLTLTPTKGPVTVYTIEHAERPSDN